MNRKIIKVGETKAMDRRKLDVLFSTMLIIISATILISNDFIEGGAESELGSMFLPRVVAGLIMIFSATIGLQSLIKLMNRTEIDNSELVLVNGFTGIFIYIGIFLVYWFVVPYVGFIITTPIIMFSVAVLLGGRNWIPITAMSIILSVLIFYGSKYYLRVYLPTWDLF
ncbi:tripartite tricarboxylate transporter TctB family protein [Amphritea sp. 1_MG-2023]|uniref:tripartite tricarboxylate transporter TctB family protein n=1 Tax=Amphritea sp. 1_MG-2023 TaxID=3062670 RepID=UPI0026E183B4|nr:tripartite tricarboxylate transporter TctB family protein [Amphritea sp. 1_MG-2023]MDO6565390.1 tripartite tricarboxylate transporter TctB family protein [Amphritea sp. 1_MG-2023]